jgi:F-type H+-transporting ATPase subunit gamma
MNMVATSRLRRAKENAINNKPYAEKTREVIAEIARNAKGVNHPLLEVRAEGKKLLLVMAADKGLAGAYSGNVMKEAVRNIEDKGNTEIVAVGRKSNEYFKHRGYSVIKSFTGVSERPKYENAKEIADFIISKFKEGEIKEVTMIYSRFVSAITCIPEPVKLLPFESDGDGKEESGFKAEYIYEPDAETVLKNLLPQYLVTVVYAAMLQAAASELSSRMNAMSNATDNAGELIQKLDLYYNKVRQAGITNEINEIVGGANALA